MKTVIVLFFSFALFPVTGQNTEHEQSTLPDLLVIDSEGYHSFIQEFQSYVQGIYPDNIPSSTNEFALEEIPSLIDSLQRNGYQLEYLYSNSGNAEICYKRNPLNSEQSFANNNEIIGFLSFLDIGGGIGIYSFHQFGEQYLELYSTQPTGLVREVAYFFKKFN